MKSESNVVKENIAIMNRASMIIPIVLVIVAISVFATKGFRAGYNETPSNSHEAATHQKDALSNGKIIPEK